MISLNIFRHADAVDFPAGQTIFNAGEPGDTMYIIKEGAIEIRSGETVFEVAGPGSVVGEMALIDKSPRSASAIARSDCKLVVVDRRRFEFLVSQTPYFSLEVMQIMAERLRHVNAMLAEATHARP